MREERAAWIAMTANLALWAAADLMWTLHYNHLDDPPSPNLADAFYLATYPCAYIGLVLLLRARLRPVRALALARRRRQRPDARGARHGAAVRSPALRHRRATR